MIYALALFDATFATFPKHTLTHGFGFITLHIQHIPEIVFDICVEPDF